MRIDIDKYSFVELIDCMGDDRTPALVARVSRNSFDKTSVEADKELTKNLLRWNHMSPFEHIKLSYFISGIPLFVGEQLIRYRTASVVKRSYRFVKIGEDFADDIEKYVYIPSFVEDKEIYLKEISNLFELYHKLIDSGIKPESARFILPIGLRTEMYYTIDLRNLFHIFEERISPHAQPETRKVVEAMFVIAYNFYETIIKYWVEIKGTDYIKKFFAEIKKGGVDE